LHLNDNPTFGEEDVRTATHAGHNYSDKSRSQWICVVTGLEMNGKFRFVYDWTDGRVLSERAYKLVKEDEATRIVEPNMVLLNPETDADIDLMEMRMEGRREREKAEKKAKKQAKRKAKDDGKEAAEFKVPTASTSTNGSFMSNNGTTSSDKNALSSSSSAAKKSKTTNGKTETDKKKKEKGVQNDPTKSEVYKSLFDTHKDALNRPKGNWVTFDPRYN
jgi:hypothetical protein